MTAKSLCRPPFIFLVGILSLGLSSEVSRSSAQETPTLEFAGATMGTRYMVKVFDPKDLDPDIQLKVDALLRRINDQMSTYLKSSELSRFNQSTSTDWFDVSPATAEVVAFALTVSEKTDGAFDVTVGPLVNAWSFGPDPRTQTVPDAAELEELRKIVGFKRLAVRAEPPALRKSVAGLQVDLSAVAKGYAVDRVVALLNDADAANVFVEIGGEVRTSGSKAGQWWKVGIQVPDASQESVLIAHSMNRGNGDDESMATSGDYRNYFEVDGVRYSHTMDPRTGAPIKHPLASVSVIAESCMSADAWATAINVLGPSEGIAAAEQEGLAALLISRDGKDFVRSGTGSLAQYAGDSSSAASANAAKGNGGEGKPGGQAIAVAILTACAFGLVLSAMAVGVMFGRRAISGSCGGLANSRNDDGSVSCSLCSNPSDACQELREKMKSEATNT